MLTNLTDSLERTLALSCEHSFIVQAPAGSGKTELLTQRFLKLLEIVESPEQIVALTFTKKAAFEMRARIMQALKNFENPHRLRIDTIDSFCSQLAKSLPISTGMGGMPDIEDSPGYLYQKAVQHYLASIEQQGDWVEGLCLILQHFHNRYEVVEKLFMSMLARRDQWLQLVMSGRRDPIRIKQAIQHSLMRIHEAAFAQFSCLISEDLKQQWLTLAHFSASQLFLEKKEHVILACLNITEFPDNSYDFQDVFAGLLALVFTSTYTLRKRVDKNMGFPADNPEMKKLFMAFIAELENNPILVEHLKILSELPPIILENDESKLLEALWEGLPILVAHLQLMFKQYNKVDFTEVNLKALAALGEEDNPTDLALILDYQIKHLLIDEFQDTSTIQYQLFEKIVSGWQPNDGRTLFVVGDPMQSIYRFRGAEVGLYLKLQQQGFGAIQPKNLILSSNFRSDKSIVNWVNACFKQIFAQENDMTLGKIAYSPSYFTREYKDEHESDILSTGVYCYELISCQEEAKLIFEKIKQIKQADPKASVAILVRARHHAQAIFQLCSKSNLPYQAIDMVALKNSQLISDLLMLTRAMLRQEDKLAWYSLFRSPICGLSLSDLLKLDLNLNLELNKITALSSDGQLRLNKIMKVISYWQENQYRLPLCESIKNLWLSLGSDTLYADKTNAEAFFELLKKWEESTQFGDFLVLEQKIDSLYQSPIISSAISEKISESAVQIMTIHKAKGLEFDYVFIPGLHYSTIKEDQPLVIHHQIPYEHRVDWLIAPKYTAPKSSKLYDYIHGQLQDKALYETQRLLYVAATRAKKQLIWTYVKANEQEKPAKDSFLAMLHAFLSPVIIKTNLKSAANLENNNLENKIIYSDLHTRVLSNVVLPWHNVESTLIPLVEIKEENPLNRPLVPSYEKMAILGAYLHRLLENWAQGRHLSAQAHQHNLLAMGLFQADIPEGVALILRVIQCCQQDNKFHWIMNPNHHAIQNEWALNFVRNNKLQTRIIDKFFIDPIYPIYPIHPIAGCAWIIDFKLTLDTPNPSEHVAQLTEYAKLVHNLGILGDKPLRFGLYYAYQSYWWEPEEAYA